jgi:hypothetical protein
VALVSVEASKLTRLLTSKRMCLHVCANPLRECLHVCAHALCSVSQSVKYVQCPCKFGLKGVLCTAFAACRLLVKFYQVCDEHVLLLLVNWCIVCEELCGCLCGNTTPPRMMWLLKRQYCTLRNSMAA